MNYIPPTRGRGIQGGQGAQKPPTPPQLPLSNIERRLRSLVRDPNTGVGKVVGNEALRALGVVGGIAVLPLLLSLKQEKFIVKPGTVQRRAPILQDSEKTKVWLEALVNIATREKEKLFSEQIRQLRITFEYGFRHGATRKVRAQAALGLAVVCGEDESALDLLFNAYQFTGPDASYRHEAAIKALGKAAALGNQKAEARISGFWAEALDHDMTTNQLYCKFNPYVFAELVRQTRDVRVLLVLRDALREQNYQLWRGEQVSNNYQIRLVVRALYEVLNASGNSETARELRADRYQYFIDYPSGGNGDGKKVVVEITDPTKVTSIPTGYFENRLAYAKACAETKDPRLSQLVIDQFMTPFFNNGVGLTPEQTEEALAVLCSLNEIQVLTFLEQELNRNEPPRILMALRAMRIYFEPQNGGSKNAYTS